MLRIQTVFCGNQKVKLNECLTTGIDRIIFGYGSRISILRTGFLNLKKKRQLTVNPSDFLPNGFTAISFLTYCKSQDQTFNTLTPTVSVSNTPEYPALEVCFFLLPHQIKNPVTGKLAAIKLAKKARILPGIPKMAPTCIS